MQKAVRLYTTVGSSSRPLLRAWKVVTTA